MFDPFGDFETKGYLRNSAGEKDLTIVKKIEHELFRAKLPLAIDFLSDIKRVGYQEFLATHALLFNAYYPWAGQDRAAVAPGCAIKKGTLFFCHPQECQRAVEHALDMARDKKNFAARVGHIMGLFAYAHPFLDGNGRAMLLVHGELCHRAGISIDWPKTSKSAYLHALTLEIEEPEKGHLDGYLASFIGPRVEREQWMSSVDGIQGLDGSAIDTDTTAAYANPDTEREYHEFERKRSYVIAPRSP